MRIASFLACVGLAAGCSATGVPMEAPLTVHEWGTFTSMVGSVGATLPGLHHEEEALPSFVHARAPGDPAHNKGVEGTPAGVNQKLETPVLYFYSDRAQPVTVKVDFPRGVVSQWYPDAAAYAPDYGTLSGTTPGGGSMTWHAQLRPGMSGFPAVAPSDVWAPSRNVASVPVEIGTEREQFIFYRGLGAFDTQFRATANADGSVTIANASADVIPAVFLLRLHSGGGFVQNLGPLAPGASIANIVPPVNGKEVNVDQYVADAADQVAAALRASGLTADEARAMVDTWSRSYFRTMGMRFLYVVPRTWTDALLPITITPAPASLVRTLVGRVEVLTVADEDALVNSVTAAANSGMAPATLITALGRFAEPKLRRTAELVTDPAIRQYLTTTIADATTTP
jgi:hypothetical protein